MRYRFKGSGVYVLRLIRSFLHQRGGNVAITTALALIPMILAVGASLDYIRAYNARQGMQNDLDATVLAAVKQINTQTAMPSSRRSAWFKAQSPSSYVVNDIQIDTSNHQITAIANGAVPTNLMKIANIDNIALSVLSSVKGPSTSYLNVYVVIDKSPSMLLAATPAGQQVMYKGIGCQFGCHTGDSRTAGGVSYVRQLSLRRQ